MTIRYTCHTCESVLKIKDEKAGTEGKCPKCKSVFLIPESDADDSDPGLESPDLVDDDIDMPLELTPGVEDSADFDPMDILAEKKAASPRSVGATTAQEKRPSVAELMRDFESTKKPKDKKSTDSSIPKPVAMATIGTAADALSRAYQQKRDKASQPKVKTKEVDEERQLMYDFFTKAGLAVLGLLVILYGVFSWMNRDVYSGPPLAESTGIVMQDGKPLAGVQVQFAPIVGLDDPPKGRSNAITDEEGRFTLKLTDTWSGAAVGDHEVIIYDPSGLPMVLSAEQSRQTVTDDGPNEFQFQL